VTGWTEEEKRQVADLAASGLTARMIAHRLHRSRGSVTGLAYRLGIKFKRDEERQREEERAVATSTTNTALMGVMVARARARGELPVRMIMIEPPPLVDGRLVSLLELRSSHCRWPHGSVGDDDFGFCGVQRKRHSPYCPEHHRMAYMRRKEAAS
jgi:GcrA cell cycle regulator